MDNDRIGGDYTVFVGNSCENTFAEFTVEIPFAYTRILCHENTRIGELLKTEKGKRVVQEKLLG